MLRAVHVICALLVVMPSLSGTSQSGDSAGAASYVDTPLSDLLSGVSGDSAIPPSGVECSGASAASPSSPFTPAEHSLEHIRVLRLREQLDSGEVAYDSLHDVQQQQVRSLFISASPNDNAGRNAFSRSRRKWTVAHEAKARQVPEESRESNRIRQQLNAGTVRFDDLDEADQARVRSYIVSGKSNGAGRTAFSRAQGKWRAASDAAKARLADEQRCFTPELDWDDAVLDAQKLDSEGSEYVVCTPLWHLSPSPSVLSLSFVSCSLSLSHALCLLASKFCHHADGTCC
jgi:hypothetical protein